MEPYSIYKTVFNLREKGLTYKQIQEELQKIGKNVSISHIRVMSKSMYEELGKEEASYVSDEIIYNLRQKKLSYKKIAEELQKQGKKISADTIYYRCKQIYNKKGEKDPKAKTIDIDISDEEIFALREKKMSYSEISDFFFEKGIEVSKSIIQKRCKNIYENKRIKEPRPSTKSIEGKKIDEEIVRLREEEGLSFKKIGESFPDKKRSRQYICDRYTLIQKYNNQQLSKMIFNLVETKKATLEQIEIIAEYYGVDLEKTFESIEERCMGDE